MYTTDAACTWANRATVPTSVSYEAMGGQLDIGYTRLEKMVSRTGNDPWSATHCDKFT